MSLADSLRRHKLALNGLRLVLALLVLVSHAWPLGGYGHDPHLPGHPDVTLGRFAVAGFFALSGMLVTMSGMRRSTGSFLLSRFLRVYPAYFVVLILTAAVLAPIIYTMTHGSPAGYLHGGPGGPVSYVLHNASLPFGLQFGINDIFATTTPYGEATGESVINGSLWSLPVEVRCYLVALVVVAVGRLLGTTRTCLAALAAVSALLVAQASHPEAVSYIMPDFLPAGMLELLFVFLCGALAGSVADKISLNAALVGSCAAVFATAVIIGGSPLRTVGFGTLCVLLPALAAAIPCGRLGFFHRDLSYGAYVWAFPVQQTMAFFGVNSHRVVYLLSTAALTLVCAALSWHLIEKPAMNLKRSLPIRLAQTSNARSEPASQSPTAREEPSRTDLMPPRSTGGSGA